MRKDKKDNREYFDYQEEQDDFALQNYGVKIKNRAKTKKTTKFSDRKERDLLPD